jgi:hypothetical protein
MLLCGAGPEASNPEVGAVGGADHPRRLLAHRPLRAPLHGAGDLLDRVVNYRTGR